MDIHENGDFESILDQYERTKPRLSKTLSQVDIRKKRGFLKTLRYSNNRFHKTKQYERTKMDIFHCVFVIKHINVNVQNRMFFTPFMHKNGAM